jgi:predicted SAM-dependent methyltransferase
MEDVKKKVVAPSLDPAWAGETGAVRHLVLPFLEGAEKVCDIGFGGVLIIPEAVGIDLPNMYNYREHIIPPDIACDVSEGIPVEDNFFDVCYSSHLIEDFEDTARILNEFIRILKSNGILALVFPDQKVYQQHCDSIGLAPNAAHIHKDMGLAFMKNVLKSMTNYKFDILLESDCQTTYNVVMIMKVQKNL